jgi:hypothetical protein
MVHPLIRHLFVISTIVLLLFGIAGCGDASDGSGSKHNAAATSSIRSGSKHTAGSFSKDGDEDADGTTYFDSDDQSVRYDGQLADPADRGAITSLIRRYYTAAVAGNGAKGCALIYGYELVARTADEYGGPPSVPNMSAKKCAVVLSELFRSHHRELLDHFTKLTLVSIRIAALSGSVLMWFGEGPEHRMLVRREPEGWRIGLLFDERMP